jgi:hypothetical protein
MSHDVCLGPPRAVITQLLPGKWFKITLAGVDTA